MVLDSKECKILNCWRIGKNGPIKNLILAAFRIICHFEKLLNQILQFFFFFIDIEFSFLPVFIQTAFENFDFPFHNFYFWSIWLSIYQKEIPRPMSYFYLSSILPFFGIFQVGDAAPPSVSTMTSSQIHLWSSVLWMPLEY